MRVDTFFAVCPTYDVFHVALLKGKYHHSGMAALGDSRFDEAIRSFDDAIELGSALAHSRKGNALMGQGNFAAARREFEVYLELSPDDSNSGEAAAVRSFLLVCEEVWLPRHGTCSVQQQQRARPLHILS